MCEIRFRYPVTQKQNKKYPRTDRFMYLEESQVVSEATFGSSGSGFECLQGQYDPAGLQELNKTT